ncbi:hypothetical protein NML43_06845 [Rhodopseudomonas palustris]|jgi:tRNA A37 threonylcarbamoyltransferase TsaD|uniref:hypothetical protein n=1 Tax=Rhodopseudomonas TaxID=1073 RepID=UPI000AD23995|nr:MULTISPECIES: hypothetical protein [Rhodopseudomonas]MCP9626797.1 hypothetical protein [Rhodopseudomonas palustris]
MTQHDRTNAPAIRRALASAATVLNVDILAVSAAFGIIAAVAFGAPHLRPF